ncbi:tRNA uridine-5-carboxymethylaminomethyl(34) synthesis enzyme MnmG [Planctomycetota bacterium]
MKTTFEVLVIGAGHAGCEAALASARMGASTLMLTMKADAIAELSCNPAIGGLAKGQLVKEIDALGGEMGRIADRAGVQFRELNRSKGPAVRAPRAQVGRRLYPSLMKQVVENTDNLTVLQGTVASLSKKGEEFQALLEDGTICSAGAAVIATGTFLNGLIHIGEFTEEAGRAGECAAKGLTGSLKDFGLEIGRLKTGTPPRVNGKSLDFDRMTIQHGDEEIKPFSHYHEFTPYEQMPCWITYTNPKTHEILEQNLSRAPLFTGQITGTGPRYCPSVELKIKFFPDKEQHQVFLEPEGRDTNEYYCNGISTSVPKDVQEDFIHTIHGMEQAEILRFGYAVEYDFVLPYQLNPTLETRMVENLYLAGQINGTSGYEEAAAQGLMAGINAVQKIRGKDPFTLGRHEAYIGVLIDDLITKDITEPYRMFTSLAEYRLILRQDNADLRLGKYAHTYGFITDEQYREIERINNAVCDAVSYTKKKYIQGKSLATLFCHDDKTMEDIEQLDSGLARMELEGRAREQVEIELAYAGYIERQKRQIERYKQRENISVPAGMDYSRVDGLKFEAREKLKKLKPATLGQASRIAGVSPADISILMVYLHSSGKTHGKAD